MTRYPHAVYSPASPSNIGGTLAPEAVQFFVIHVAQSDSLEGTASWFRDPAAQVSSHFGIGRDGTVYQFVDLDRMAWAEMDYNNRAISLELIGWSGERLTERQLAAGIDLLVWLHSQFPNVPLHRTADVNGRGIIGHGELGVPGGDHPDCPGWPILAQFNVALRRFTRPPRPPRRPWWFLYSLIHFKPEA